MSKQISVRLDQESEDKLKVIKEHYQKQHLKLTTGDIVRLAINCLFNYTRIFKH